jgi:GT2 family glycosyltransferase
MTRIVTIVLTFNQRDKTLCCLQSLFATRGMPFDVLVWDNGSDDGTVEAIQEAYPQVIAHAHPTNLGVASGRNAAAHLAINTLAATHLLFLDNDMLVESDFVAALYAPFAGDERVGQTQAKLRLMGNRELLNDGGGAEVNWVFGRIRPVGYGEVDRGQYDAVKSCVSCGGAMMVRAELFQQLGGFDTEFDPFGPEDLDFSLRLQKAGYQALYVPQAMAYHEVSHTYGKGYTEAYARHKSRHWILLMRRHASRGQRLGFYLIGAPYRAARALIREGRKGNLSALRGLAHGLSDVKKTGRARWRA